MGGMTPPTVRLLLLDADVLQALVDRDVAGASAMAGVAIPASFAQDTWLWTLRLGQMIGEPDQAPWLVRVVVDPDDAVVGHAGFHGPPDPRGMVEIGYAIEPGHRRRGYARGAVTQLLAYAREHGATIARASVSPDNAASLALVASFGFVPIGEQMDEIDGLELVFERQV
jgi:RimJ/RimL family protein N-acetyltransferase